MNWQLFVALGITLGFASNLALSFLGESLGALMVLGSPRSLSHSSQVVMHGVRKPSLARCPRSSFLHGSSWLQTHRASS